MTHNQRMRIYRAYIVATVTLGIAAVVMTTLAYYTR